jgi:hypothetical protein
MIILLIAGCGNKAAEIQPDASPPPQRPINPPSDKIHVYPPHAIRSDGVGPYRLDAPLEDVMQLADPGLEFLELPGGARWRVVRAEDGKLIIGADGRNRVAFIGVLAGAVARTPKGNQVGSSFAQLAAELGPPVRERRIATRRSVTFDKLPNVRFFSEAPVDDAAAAATAADAKVAGVLVVRSGAVAEGQDRPRAPAPAGLVGPPSPCVDGGPLRGVAADELLSAVRAGKGPRSAPAVIRYGCISGSGPEALVLVAGELSLVSGLPGKLHRLWSVTVPEAEAVGAVDVDGDGHDEVVTLGVVRSGQEIAAQVRVFAWEAGKLAGRASARVIAFDTVTTAGEATQVELWPEVHAEGGALVVGGEVAVRGAGNLLITLAPVAPAQLTIDLRRGGVSVPAPDDSDAGPAPDAAIHRSQKAPSH